MACRNVAPTAEYVLQHLCPGWPALTAHSYLFSWQYSSKLYARMAGRHSSCKTLAGLDRVFQPTFSGRESLQHPQYPHSSGLARLHSPDTSGLLYFIPNPERRMFAAADKSQRQKISVLPLAGEMTWAGALTEPGGRRVFLSGQFSQFSQVLDASDVPDIWIQFLQRKNLRHFNPFGGLKSRRK